MFPVVWWYDCVPAISYINHCSTKYNVTIIWKHKEQDNKLLKEKKTLHRVGKYESYLLYTHFWENSV